MDSERTEILSYHAMEQRDYRARLRAGRKCITASWHPSPSNGECRCDWCKDVHRRGIRAVLRAPRFKRPRRVDIVNRYIKPSNSLETAGRFFNSAESKRRQRALCEASAREARDFREVVLVHVSVYESRTGGEIARLVNDDWGSVCVRRVHRAVKRLIADGLVVRTEDGIVRVRRAA